jgi:hypothetical protein
MLARLPHNARERSASERPQTFAPRTSQKPLDSALSGVMNQALNVDRAELWPDGPDRQKETKRYPSDLTAE